MFKQLLYRTVFVQISGFTIVGELRQNPKSIDSKSLCLMSYNGDIRFYFDVDDIAEIEDNFIYLTPRK